MYRSIKISKFDVYSFYKSAQLAQRGQHRVRCGVLLTKNNKPLGASWNRERNDIDNVPFGYATYHAEQHVLRMNQANVFGCTLFIARLSVDGNLMASFPCTRCMTAIQLDSKVSKLVYFDGKSLVKIRL